MPTSYHKLSLEVIKRLSGPVPRRPSSQSAAERGDSPSSASAKGQVIPSQAPHGQPSPAAAGGRLSPSQPSEEQLAADTAEGRKPPSQPVRQLSAAVTKGRISPPAASSQGSQSLLQQMGSANGQSKAGPGLSKAPRVRSARFASTAQAAVLTQPKAHTMDNASAERKACGPDHSRLPHGVNLSGKSAAVARTRTADPSAAVSTASTAVSNAAASVKNHAAATSSAAASQNASASMAGTAAHKAHGDTQPAQLAPGKRQTAFNFEDVEDHPLETGSGRAAMLQSEGSLTHKIMQQMTYTGKFEDQNHLFLEVRTSLQSLAHMAEPVRRGDVVSKVATEIYEGCDMQPINIKNNKCGDG